MGGAGGGGKDPGWFVLDEVAGMWVAMWALPAGWKGALAAYALSKHLRWHRLMMFLIVFTMLFNGGIVPRYLIVKGVGILRSHYCMSPQRLRATSHRPMNTPRGVQPC